MTFAVTLDLVLAKREGENERRRRGGYSGCVVVLFCRIGVVSRVRFCLKGNQEFRSSFASYAGSKKEKRFKLVRGAQITVHTLVESDMLVESGRQE